MVSIFPVWELYENPIFIVFRISIKDVKNCLNRIETEMNWFEKHIDHIFVELTIFLTKLINHTVALRDFRVSRHRKIAWKLSHVRVEMLHNSAKTEYFEKPNGL